jgi:GTP-binding protein
MADIPGIIEGASEGAGLGHDFLRHIERCRLLVHVIDVSGSEGRDPIADFEAINEELVRYNPELAARPQIVAANKCDIADAAAVESFRDYVEAKGHKFFEISAATHKGVSELVAQTAEELSKLPPIQVFEPDYVEPEPKLGTSDELTIEVEDGVYYISGAWMERLLGGINFSDTESKMYFDRTLRTSGLFERLEEMGISEGDIVSIYDMEFEYRR